MAIQKTASGKVDKRTKEYKEMVARAKKARAAQKKAAAKKTTIKKSSYLATRQLQGRLHQAWCTGVLQLVFRYVCPVGCRLCED